MNVSSCRPALLQAVQHVQALLLQRRLLDLHHLFQLRVEPQDLLVALLDARVRLRAMKRDEQLGNSRKFLQEPTLFNLLFSASVDDFIEDTPENGADLARFYLLCELIEVFSKPLLLGLPPLRFRLLRESRKCERSRVFDCSSLIFRGFPWLFHVFPRFSMMFLRFRFDLTSIGSVECP